MRDRLIKLLQKRSCFYNKCKGSCSNCDYVPIEDVDFDSLADYLLANGVIVPLCKVGDIIWVKDYERNCEIQKAEIIAILKNRYGTYIRYEYPAFRGQVYARNVEYIGKDVFLTKEEAEKALKECEPICDYIKTDWNDCCECSAKDHCAKYNERSEIIGELLGEVIGETKN